MYQNAEMRRRNGRTSFHRIPRKRARVQEEAKDLDALTYPPGQKSIALAIRKHQTDCKDSTHDTTQDSTQTP
jgi:hypothetical protein